MHLEPVAGVRGDEGAPAAVCLDAKTACDRALEHLLELVLVEREPEVVDARHLPLPGLDDDVDAAALHLGQPQLEAEPVELLPRHPGLERLVLLADTPVPRDQPEAELADVPRLDLPDLARHEVIVEELHRAGF